MELPRRKFYTTDLFHPNLYEKIWADTMYVTHTFIYRLILEDARQTEKLSKGNDDYWLFLDTIQCYNRCFVKLIDSGEATGAVSFVRLQMDNLIVLYAESISIGNVLHKIFDNKRELNQITINGEKYNNSGLIKKLDEKYKGIHEMWKNSNLYIHPSYKTNSLEALCLDSYYSKKLGREVIPQRVKKELYKEMVFINQIIVDLLHTILDSHIALIKEHRLYSFYKRHIAEAEI